MTRQKTLGVIGGMSWESSVLYYRHLNRKINAQLGGLHSANVVLQSVDFEPISQLQHAGDWDSLEQQLTQVAQRLELQGVDGVAIATNTMHKLADAIQDNITIPLLHIGDAVVSACHAKDVTKVGLLGTKFTMQEPFYKQRLIDKGIDVVVPDSSGMDVIHNCIYDELCKGEINPASRQLGLDVIRQLQQQGAQAIVLGCTELTLLFTPDHTDIPLLDTTELHCDYLTQWMLD